jgi:uncharacterized protein (TIGR03083 family)
VPDAIAALQSSVERLAALVAPLDDDAIVAQAHPTEWSVAEVLSHLGSGAVIFARRIADGLAGVETPEEFNPSVWAEWDAKSPRAQVDDALVADAAFAAQVAAVPQADRDRFTTSFGPMTIGFDRAVGMRLSEHLLHEWDVRVTLDPAAALASDGAGHVIGNLGPIVAFSGKSTGGSDTVVIATTDPEGQWAVTTTPDGLTFDRIDTWDEVHVTMPTEALVRLIYGRLPPEHTPDSVEADADTLHRLRAMFPGF